MKYYCWHLVGLASDWCRVESSSWADWVCGWFVDRSEAVRLSRLWQGVQAQTSPDRARSSSQRREAVPLRALSQDVQSFWLVFTAHEEPVQILQASPASSSSHGPAAIHVDHRGFTHCCWTVFRCRGVCRPIDTRQTTDRQRTSSVSLCAMFCLYRTTLPINVVNSVSPLRYGLQLRLTSGNIAVKLHVNQNDTTLKLTKNKLCRVCLAGDNNIYAVARSVAMQANDTRVFFYSK